MNPEQTEQFNEMIRKVGELYEWMKQKKTSQITTPVDDASRKNMGVGFIGKTADTTPAGSLLVNTQEGPVKILYAA